MSAGLHIFLTHETAVRHARPHPRRKRKKNSCGSPHRPQTPSHHIPSISPSPRTRARTAQLSATHRTRTIARAIPSHGECVCMFAFTPFLHADVRSQRHARCGSDSDREVVCVVRHKRRGGDDGSGSSNEGESLPSRTSPQSSAGTRARV